jgi:polyisoprenoid-binding protein YceI
MRVPRAMIALLGLAALPAEAQQTGELLEIDEARTRVVAITDVAGLLGRLGDRHTVEATEIEGEVCAVAGEPSSLRGSARIPTASLVIDEPQTLEEFGLDGPGRQHIPDLQLQLLSREYLHAEGHPQLRFEGEQAEPRGNDGVTLRGPLTLRGQTRQVAVPLELSRDDDGTLRARGRVTVKHTDFGMTPHSVAGVVRVADPVELYIDLVATPTGRPCP